MFWEGIFRGIIGAIDGTIYWFIELLLQLVLDLANTQIFSQSVINEFANRIYIILGLVMLFKIIISFIQILINPDKMDDKEQGVGNILMRVVISLILIVLVPSIFSLARQIQSYVIPVIPKVILGSTAGSIDDGTSEEFMATGGRAMAFYTYTAFFTYSDPSCNDGSIYGTGNDPTAVVVYDIGSAVEHIKEECAATGGYKYNHGFPLSTIVGIFLIFMLVQISIAVAIRAIKLGICEFIAPIPIASYIDPKTSKQAFDNWVSTSIKTYLDLFTRLIIVYFVVFVFMIIVSNESLDIITANLGGDTTRQSLVIVALIIGLLQFAKQAPKFISDMLGVKEGFGDIGGMFKGAAGLAGTLGALGVAATRGFKGGLQNSRGASEGGLLTAGRAVSGMLSSGVGAVASRLKGKGIRESINTSVNNHLSKQKQSIARTRAFHTGEGPTGTKAWFSGVMQQKSDNASARIGAPTKKQSYDYTIGNLEAMSSAYNEGIQAVDSHKLAKFYKNQYLAAQNVGLEQFVAEENAGLIAQQQEYAKQLSDLSTLLSRTPESNRTRRKSLQKNYDQIKAEYDSVTSQINNPSEETRNRARTRQAAYVNQAQRTYTDAQKRLLKAASQGNVDVLTAEDKAILQNLGLNTEEDMFNDGNVLQNVGISLHAAEAAINDKLRDDKRTREFLERPENSAFYDAKTGQVDLSSKEGIDAIGLFKTQLQKDPDYYRSQFTDTSQQGNNH